MNRKSGFRTEINGCVATAEDLSSLAFAGFAHFTAMQVREGAVRGLEFHLARLRSASIEFFGQALPDELVRGRIRHAIESAPSALSVTATMFSRRGEFTPTGASDDPAILVRTAPPSMALRDLSACPSSSMRDLFRRSSMLARRQKHNTFGRLSKRAMTTQHSSIPVGA